MNKYIEFYAHDPIGNVEGLVTDFDPEGIQSAALHGILFIGLNQDGTREVVDPADVVDPNPIREMKLPIITHQVFMDVLGPIVDAIDKLAMGSEGFPVSTLSLTAEKSISETVREAYEKAVEGFKADFPDGYESEGEDE